MLKELQVPRAHRTCSGDAGEHPALAELDRFAGAVVLLQYFDGALPLGRGSAAPVIAAPVTLQNAILVTVVHLREGAFGKGHDGDME